MRWTMVTQRLGAHFWARGPPSFVILNMSGAPVCTLPRHFSEPSGVRDPNFPADGLFVYVNLTWMHHSHDYATMRGAL